MSQEQTKKGFSFKKLPIKMIALIGGAGVVIIAIIAIVVSGALAPASATALETYTVKTEDIARTFLVSGTVKSDSTTNVYAPSALKILDVHVVEGDTVRPGDVLATLDTSMLELDIRQAELNLENARAQLTAQERDLANNQNSASLSVKSASTDASYAKQVYNDTVETTAASVRTAQVDLEAAQRKYEDLLAQQRGTSAVIQAQADLTSAQLKYDQLAMGVDYTVENQRLAMEKARQDYDNAVKSNKDADNMAAADPDYVKPATLPNVDSMLLAYQQAQVRYEESLNTHRTNLDNARIALDKARVSLDSTVKTADDNLIAAKDAYDKAQITLENALKNQNDSIASAKNSLDRARNSLSSANASEGYNAERTVETSHISVQLQEVSLEKMMKQLNDATIRAATGGVITYKRATEGETASGLMFVIEETDRLVVETTVGESDIGTLQVGQRAQIRTDTIGEERLPGEVSYIADAAVKQADGTTSNSTNVQFTVKVRLDEPDPRVKIGMNARMTITLDAREGVVAVPFEAVGTLDGHSVVYVYEEGVKTPRAVQVDVGLETDTMIEIISGEIGADTVIYADAESAVNGGRRQGGGGSGLMMNMGGGF